MGPKAPRRDDPLHGGTVCRLGVWDCRVVCPAGAGGPPHIDGQLEETLTIGSPSPFAVRPTGQAGSGLKFLAQGDTRRGGIEKQSHPERTK
ncbi:MAG: hypothetical protein M1339_06350 [Bacteroidetes bacterium]|nr:hypothetical protein [Bacteroidota bacterium]